MRKVTQFLIYVLLISIILGQFSRIPIGNSLEGGIYLSDICVTLVFFSWGVTKFKEKKLRLNLLDFTTILFWLVLAISLIYAISWVTITEFIIAALYLIRLGIYLSLHLVVRDTFDKRISYTWFTGIGLAFASAGLFQLLLFPNFAKYVGAGWDPHYYRVLSTFFDPNYAGMFMVILFTYVLFGLYENKELRTMKNVGILLFILAMILLTFSRSTYLAFIVAVGFFSLFKDRRILLAVLIIGLISFLAIPRVRTRVIGAITFDATVQLRFADYQKTYDLIVKDSPWLGVGFNTLRYAKIDSGYYRDERGVNLESGHSGAGADSSLLFTTATSGVIGLIGLILWWVTILVSSFLSKNKALLVSVSLALFIHSQFVNSFFYTPILALFLIILGNNLIKTSYGFGKEVS